MSTTQATPRALDTSMMSPAATHLAFLRTVAASAPIPSYRATYARQARELADLIIQAGCRPVLGERSPLARGQA